MPSGLLEYYGQMSKTLGGENYLRALAKEIVSACSTTEEMLREIYVFVQNALFRDPIAQPLAENGLPDSTTILMCARGRCGHASKVIVDLCTAVGIEANTYQFPNHLIAIAEVEGRTLILDADAFKNGVVPLNEKGQLISLDDVRKNPYLLDNFPPVGWILYNDNLNLFGVFGKTVLGYTDYRELSQRGFVSGFYDEQAQGYPPTIVRNIRIQNCRKAIEDRWLNISWGPSTVINGEIEMYKISIGSHSRGWNYNNLLRLSEDADLQLLPEDIGCFTTQSTQIEISIPPANTIYVSITAISDRISINPKTYFWPSEEVVIELEKQA
jgi:hypothetical protein